METVLEELAHLRKEVTSLTKLVRKIRNFQEDPNGEKAAERSKSNGFNRPLKVSDELKSFLGLGEEETISRSDVTKRLNKYVKDNGLKHPDNGRVIVMDNTPKKLQKPPSDIQVTFLNVQKYLSPHYTKIDVPEPKPEVSTEVSTEESSTEDKPKKRPTVKKTKA